MENEQKESYYTKLLATPIASAHRNGKWFITPEGIGKFIESLQAKAIEEHGLYYCDIFEYFLDDELMKPDTYITLPNGGLLIQMNTSAVSLISIKMKVNVVESYVCIMKPKQQQK